jgi:nitrite reductase/ring-hydroxylating ferredoxin subunit
VEGFVRVARLSQIPPGGMLPVRVGDEDVVLYNVGGTIRASRDFCPHAGFPLSGGVLRGKYVRCGLHGWEFDVLTGHYVANAHVSLRRYEVKVEGEEVFVGTAALPPLPPPPPPSRSRDDV